LAAIVYVFRVLAERRRLAPVVSQVSTASRFTSLNERKRHSVNSVVTRRFTERQCFGVQPPAASEET